MAAKARMPPRMGSAFCVAAEAGHLPGVVAVLDGAGQEEEQAGDHPVGHHAHDGGVDAHVGEGGDPQHHEAHGPRGEGDEALHVGLRQAGQRP